MSLRPDASRTTIRWCVLLALCLLPGIATNAHAQGRGPEDERTLAAHRLTMPEVRRVMSAMRDASVDPEMRTIREQRAASGTFPDHTKMSIAELAADLDAMPPSRRALARAGLNSREAATTYAALLRALRYVSQEETASVPGGRMPAALPSGAAAQNVALVKQNKAELDRLSGRTSTR